MGDALNQLVVIGFEVLTTMLMKGTVFWDITLVTS
jgi:hypothetical protein